MTLPFTKGDFPVVLAAIGLPCCYVIYSAITKQKQRRAFSKFTAVDELSILGRPRVGPRIEGTAVVVGGSFAGMFTALACSNHFERVVIIEADEGADAEPAKLETKDLPGGLKGPKSKRTRLVQAHSLHLFQPFTLYALRRWFQGFDEKATANGHRISPYLLNPCLSCLPIPSDCLTADELGLPKHPNIDGSKRMESIWADRWNLEPLVRRLMLEQYKNIQIVNGLVNGVVLDSTPHSNISVESVTYTDNHGKNVETIPASLVIDCTGATTGGVKWLSRAGLSPPEVTSFNPNLYYAGILLKVQPDMRDRLPIPGGYPNAEWFYTNMSDPKYGNRSIFCNKSDDDHIFIAWFGFGAKPGDLPRTPEDVKDFHRNIPAAKGAPPPPEWVCDMIDILTENNGWENGVYSDYHINSCALTKYHEYQELPSNFIAIGDSIMRSSPTYGLGTTKAAVGAATLEGLLRQVKGTKLSDNFAKTFIGKQHDRTVWSWEQSKLGDYCYPTTEPVEGEKLDDAKQIGGLVYRLFRIAHLDRKVAARAYHGRVWLYPTDEAFSTWSMIRAFLYWFFVE